MTIFYMVREIADANGRPTGKYRYTEQSDESEHAPIWGLCEHEHGSVEEAEQCPDARRVLTREFPAPPANPIEAYARGLELVVQEYKERFAALKDWANLYQHAEDKMREAGIEPTEDGLARWRDDVVAGLLGDIARPGIESDK
jgi:hypothetical protein